MVVEYYIFKYEYFSFLFFAILKQAWVGPKGPSYYSGMCVINFYLAKLSENKSKNIIDKSNSIFYHFYWKFK